MLKTPFEKGDVPFADYPRPQLMRDSYLCLNGKWTMNIRRDKRAVETCTVTVPFPPESAASGCDKPIRPTDTLEYMRTFSLPTGFVKDRVILHIGAVDQEASVFVNGMTVGPRGGGYLPLSWDITDALCEGENELRVVVTDPLDPDIPYGKQRKKRGGMWYTPISGIWQTVWLESVPKRYIRSLRIIPTLDSVTVKVFGGTAEKCLTLDGREYRFEGDSITLTIDDPVHWSPENPHLYDFTLRSGEDTVTSYFALRTLSVGEVNGTPRLLLNGKPYFFNGLLDQGYFADGIYLPSSEEGYRFDVRLTKELGFDTLRKHIKIEPEVFYYECDKQGVIVFQDMVNNGRYSFLLDTALPTIGLRQRLPRRRSKRQRAVFEGYARATVAHLYNHPCVCCYTIFNEGWGQFDADGMYRKLKALDPTRIWDTTSGWFFGKESDVQSEHVYFRPVKLKAGKRPLVLSEFGGYSCAIEGHMFNPQKVYGYRLFDTPQALTQGLLSLYRDEILPAVRNGLCAAILTQLSDVEDEVNGFVTYDRQVVKVDTAAMRAVNEELTAAFEECI